MRWMAAAAILVIAADISPGGTGIRPESLEFVRALSLPSQFHQRNIASFDSDAGARRVAVVDTNHRCFVIDGTTGETALRIGDGQVEVISTAVDPGGRWVAVGCRDGRMRLYDAVNGEMIAMAPGGNVIARDIPMIIASPTGRFVAAVTSTGELIVIRAPGGNLVARADISRPNVQAGRGLSVTFTRDESEIFFASIFGYYGSVRLDTGRATLRDYPVGTVADGRRIYLAAASPDGRTIAMYTGEYTIFDSERGVIVQRLDCREGSDSMTFIANGQFLAIASAWELWLWDPGRWTRRRVLRVDSNSRMGRAAAAGGVGWVLTAQDSASPPRVFVWGPRGRVTEHRPGFLGVRYNRQVQNSAIISELLPDAPAERGGLLPGDVVLRVADEPVTQYQQAIQIIQQHFEGEDVPILVRRNDQELTLTIRLAPAPPR